MVDVFISYKREERSRAESISKKLQSLGLEVWFDTKVPSGTLFDREIENALQQAKAVLVLWSPGAARSDWVRNEASAGKERDALVALMLAPCELPFAFRGTQYEPLYEARFSDDHPSWLKTIERIKGLAGKRAEIEKVQTKKRSARRRNHTLLWLLAWPVGAAACLVISSVAFNEGGRLSTQGSGFFANLWDRGYVVVSGTWEVEGEELAARMNHVEITCDREQGTCLEATAEVYQGLNNLLSVRTESRPIESWTTNSIVTREEAGCADYVMTINRDTEGVTALQVRHPEREPQSSLVDCSLLSQRNEYRLVDGADRSLREVLARRRLIGNVFWTMLVIWSLYVVYRIFRVFRPRLKWSA